MTTTPVREATSSRIAVTSELGVFATLRRGLQLSPEIARGLGLTLTLAFIATGGRIVVPIAVQQTIDTAINVPGGPLAGRVAVLVSLAALGVAITGICSYFVNLRLVQRTEEGLATLRIRAFRHVHDLSTLTQSTERRGALVSRVTSDVDTISMFVQWGGMQLILSTGQLIVATVLMAWYSWKLALVVWAVFIPMMLAAPVAQRMVSRAYGLVRERMGAFLGAVSESIVGAETIRVYGVNDRTRSRLDAANVHHRKAAVRAQTMVSLAFSGGVLSSGLAIATVMIVGTFLGMNGELSIGRLVAFFFLVQLFTGPVQIATEVLNELQNAVAGWRRVIAILESPIDVADPQTDAQEPLPGPIDIAFSGVSFAYPSGPRVLHNINVDIAAGTRVAVVGETGSGKTTMARLLTRLMDPAEGAVKIGGVDLRSIRRQHLRSRITLVPQEGYLFTGSLAENIALGGADVSRDDVEEAIETLGLSDWVAGFPDGLDTPVGQRGEQLSAGERQLVALARAAVADPDLLVLDEATSAVDPETEVQIQRALEHLTSGRTSLAIAHRLSTAEAADLILVVDAGRIVERGRHDELLENRGRYFDMYQSWVAQTR
ncbi:MAG TPA: ABC transporter ATP-binding protein [Actinomycetales bacterium]|nr:ABC transporter ATP-binding protein [Actinomycetales bacterium]